MSAEALAEAPVPSSSRPAPVPDSLNTVTAAWARAFFSHRNRVAAALELIGAIAIASVLPLHHWARPEGVVLVVAIGAAGALAGLRVAIGSRLPPWSLQVDVALGNLIVSVVVAASAREHVDLANLYLLVEVFAVLYLPLRAALAHTAAAGAAYAALLGLDFGPAPAEPGAVAWLAVFATAAILGAAVLGLVSVLRVAARADPLTGLANRRLWDERLEEELERSRRNGTPLSVIVVDLDGFKAVNDACGHQAGDQLLQELAHAWQVVVRGSGDLLARLGGDEFGLLAPGSDDTGIRRLAKRVAEVVPEGVAASVGIATWDGAESAANLLRRADRAMYQAKRRRRRGEGLRQG